MRRTVFHDLRWPGRKFANVDHVAVGPAVRPKTFFNTRGRVVSIEGDMAHVTLDPGDRDRVERATGKTVKETMSFPLEGLEKLA